MFFFDPILEDKEFGVHVLGALGWLICCRHKQGAHVVFVDDYGNILRKTEFFEVDLQ